MKLTVMNTGAAIPPSPEGDGPLAVRLWTAQDEQYFGGYLKGF